MAPSLSSGRIATGRGSIPDPPVTTAIEIRALYADFASMAAAIDRRARPGHKTLARADLAAVGPQVAAAAFAQPGGLGHKFVKENASVVGEAPGMGATGGRRAVS